MYKIKILNFEKQYLLEELIKVFLRPDQYVLLKDNEDPDSDTIIFNSANHQDRNAIKREIFDALSSLTGEFPEWGILTGIRPVKLYGELCVSLGSETLAKETLKRDYYISDDRLNLIRNIYNRQISEIGEAPDDSACIYIGIPFCPTRCVYCSFASNQVDESEYDKYLEALITEIKFCGKRMNETGIKPESLYIGGGTPTSFSAQQLDILIKAVKKHINFDNLKEFTIEAGRPDTITYDKLKVIKDNGIDRISINPQSMKAETLDLIGRNHSPEDIVKAFEMAKEVGISNVNADIIAGLPDESLEDFVDTLNKVIELEPANITVHSLAVKRASKLKLSDPDFHYKQGKIVARMLEESKRILADNGYAPYYLYRQKHMAGAYENVGYTKPGKDCIYNIRIMDEHQHNIALGAGGITKVYFPKENRLERVPNVTNYEEYIKRTCEMIERKEINLFKEVE